MRLISASGKLVKKSVTSYLIDWDAKSRSIAQYNVKQFLKKYWYHNMVYEEFPVYGTLLKVDILNATKKIGIELHGPQHEEFHYFHNGSRLNYLKGIKNDCVKAKWLEDNKYQHVIIYTKEISELSENFFLEKFNINL